MAFNEQKYKDIFDKRFGAGAFDSGLSSARNIGATKAQAAFEKAQYNQRIKELEKARKEALKEAEKREKNKTYDDALSHWNLNKTALREQGANRHAENIRNDPRLKAQIKEQGYTLNDYIDAMYYASSDGRFRSEREFKEFSKAEQKEANRKPTIDELIRKHNQAEEPKAEPVKAIEEPKKERSAGDKVADFFKGTDVDNDGERDGLLGFVDRYIAPISKGATEFVAPGNAERMAMNSPDNPVVKATQIDRGLETKILNTGGMLAAAVAPYGQGYKLANHALNKLPSFAKIANPYAKKAITGGLAGGIAESGISAVNELVNSEAYDMKDHAFRAGIGIVGGAILDPAMHGIYNLIKGARAAKNVRPQAEEMLALPPPKETPAAPLGLPEPQLQLPSPKVNPTLETFNSLFKQPSGLSSPIPEMPDVLRKAFNRGEFEQAGVNFAQSGKYTPKSRPHLTPVEASLDPLNRGQSYWQGRYEDFARHVNKNYDMNQMTPEALEDLWSSFAKYDEPIRLEQAVDLAYPKGFEAPPAPKSVQGPKEPNLKDVLKADDSITERVKGLFPPNKPEPKISRLATLDESFKHIEDLAPPKPQEQSFEPLKFSRPQQFKQGELPKGFENITKNSKKNNFEAIEPTPVDEGGKLTRVKDVDSEFNTLLANSEKWKDKAKLLLKREPMLRIFEDVMGKDAPKFIKKYIEPIQSKEAERIRFLNTERDKVKSFGIKPRSKDDQLVQQFGEKKITLEELKQKTTNWEKVVEVSESYRKKYDELLSVVNKVLKENGFDEIPKRENYFPHYQEVDGMMKQFGFDMQNHALPTDINGLTADFKPNKSFFSHALRRKGEETTFGAVEGFDRYIEGISNLIYHTKNVKELRALDKAVRQKHSGDTHLSNFASELTEYTNIMAGKKSMADRSFEDTVGRKIYNAVDTIRRRTAVNMVGANVASALTNYIPLTQALATTRKDAFVKGMLQTMKNVKANDGFIQQSDFLTKRIGSDPLVRTLWDTAVDKSMWLMKSMDYFSAQTIVRGKYNELIGKGLSHGKAIKQADDWAARIMADRSKGGMPTLFNSKTLGIVSQFQLEVNNQLSFIFKDVPRKMGSKAAMASALGQIAIYSFAFNELYEKAVGRRPAFDPIGVALQAQEDYNNDNITNSQATKRLSENVLGQLPFTSALTGGRFPIAAGNPDINAVMDGKSSLGKELAKPFWHLALPAGGGQIKKTYEGLTAMNKNPFSPQGTTGVYQTTKSGDKIMKYPVEDNLQNRLRAAFFGKYSLPETGEFYDKNRRNLSANQTLEVEQSSNPKQAYEAIQFTRKEKSLYDKIIKMQNDKNLSKEEKAKAIHPLIEQLEKLLGR